MRVFKFLPRWLRVALNAVPMSHDSPTSGSFLLGNVRELGLLPSARMPNQPKKVQWDLVALSIDYYGIKCFLQAHASNTRRTRTTVAKTQRSANMGASLSLPGLSARAIQQA